MHKARGRAAGGGEQRRPREWRTQRGRFDPWMGVQVVAEQLLQGVVVCTEDDGLMRAILQLVDELARAP
jgi:hypothetical protein